MLKLNLDNNHSIRYLEIEAGTYNQDRKIKFGLQSPIGIADALISTINGRVSVLSFADAQRIADLISTQFDTPVRVIRDFKIPRYRQNEFVTDGAIHPGLNEGDVYLPEALEITDLSRIREIIQFCEQQGYISTDMRANLNPFITQIETELADAARISDVATPAQTEVIRLVAEPYVDAIIEDTRNAASNEALLGRCTEWGYTLTPNTSRRDIALGVLLDTMQRHPETLFLEQFVGLEDACLESGKALNSMYQGTATLESTYRRQGAGIPSIQAQRKVLLELMEEKLTAAFGEERNPQVLAYSKEYLQALRKTLFVEGCEINAIQMQGDNYNVITVNNSRSVLQGLRGDPTSVRFAAMRSETENRMLLAEMPFQS